MHEKSNDLQIVDRFKDGETAAFEELVLKYQDRIFNLCRYMLGNSQDAEDAAQDTFVKAYRNMESFKPRASFYTWLYRIAVNTCLDYKKRPFFESLSGRSGGEGVHEVEHKSNAPLPDKLYEAKQIGQALQVSLAKLSNRLRPAIVLKEIEGLSYEEIADVLDISIGTVKSRISRAREELQKSMKEFTEQK